MNCFGPLLGCATLMIIGAGFVWVIRCEYYLGYAWFPYIMGTGALVVIGSLFIPSMWGSALVGIIGASIAWGSTELKAQAVRAEIGWYPFNPAKKPKPASFKVLRK